MPKSAYAQRQNDLIDAIDEFPDFAIDFEERRNGGYAIHLTDFETGEIFEI